MKGLRESARGPGFRSSLFRPLQQRARGVRGEESERRLHQIPRRAGPPETFPRRVRSPPSLFLLLLLLRRCSMLTSPSDSYQTPLTEN